MELCSSAHKVPTFKWDIFGGIIRDILDVWYQNPSNANPEYTFTNFRKPNIWNLRSTGSEIRFWKNINFEWYVKFVFYYYSFFHNTGNCNNKYTETVLIYAWQYQMVYHHSSLSLVVTRHSQALYNDKTINAVTEIPVCGFTLTLTLTLTLIL
jgi:hypothetical protein